MRSNCLFWAHWRYWRALTAWRKSGAGHALAPRIPAVPSIRAPWWVAHFEVRTWDGEHFIVESYDPIDKRKLPWWKLPIVILFRGEVVRRED